MIKFIVFKKNKSLDNVIKKFELFNCTNETFLEISFLINLSYVPKDKIVTLLFCDKCLEIFNKFFQLHLLINLELQIKFFSFYQRV